MQGVGPVSVWNVGHIAANGSGTYRGYHYSLFSGMIRIFRTNPEKSDTQGVPSVSSFYHLESQSVDIMNIKNVFPLK